MISDAPPDNATTLEPHELVGLLLIVCSLSGKAFDSLTCPVCGSSFTFGGDVLVDVAVVLKLNTFSSSESFDEFTQALYNVINKCVNLSMRQSF